MKKAIVLILTVSLLMGCMGTGAVNGKVKEFNLKVVENRWGREGTFLALITWVVFKNHTN